MAIDVFLKLSDIDGESVGQIIEEYGEVLGDDAEILLKTLTSFEIAENFDFRYFEVSSGPPEDGRAASQTEYNQEIDIISWSLAASSQSSTELTEEEIEALILLETGLEVDVEYLGSNDPTQDYIKISLTDLHVPSFTPGGGGGSDLSDPGNYDLLV